VIERLVRHGFFRELRVSFIGVGYKGHAAGGEHTDAVDLAPFLEMPGDDFFDVVGNVDAADVESAVLAHEAAYAAHVVTVVAVLVPTEAIYVRVVEVVQPW